ncbi:MAG: hypothetical protein ABEN55_02460, partial [Bradymonadaceae bacterium]
MADTEQTSDDTERRPRRKWVAAALSFLCPGLGLMYVGKLAQGLRTNLLFVVALSAVAVLFAVVDFFPGLPLLVLAVGWLVVSSLITRDVWADIDARPETYELRA